MKPNTVSIGNTTGCRRTSFLRTESESYPEKVPSEPIRVPISLQKPSEGGAYKQKASGEFSRRLFISPYGSLFQGLPLFREKLIPFCKVHHGIRERKFCMPDKKADHISVGSASETMVELLSRSHFERRGFLIMKWTPGNIFPISSGTGLFQRKKTPHHIHHIHPSQKRLDILFTVCHDDPQQKEQDCLYSSPDRPMSNEKPHRGFPRKYPCKSAIFTRSCFIVSRTVTVTVPSRELSSPWPMVSKLTLRMGAPSSSSQPLLSELLSVRQPRFALGLLIFLRTANSGIRAFIRLPAQSIAEQDTVG